MDKSAADSLILENMVLAERIGQKYAHRNNRLQAEAVAESYFWLVSFFYIDHRLYTSNPDDFKRTLGTYIKRALIKYFERRGYLENQPLVDKVVRNTDEEMIEFLSGLMPDEDAFKVFHYLRQGVNFFEIDIVDPRLIKVVKKLRLQVVNRLRRIKELKDAGIKVSRDVIDAVPMEDEGLEAGGVSYPTGVGGGLHDPQNAPGEQGQHEIDSPVAA